MISLLIADDHPFFLEGLSSIIETRHKDIRIKAKAANGHEAVEAYRKYCPDVVIMDINMPEMDGIEAAREIREIDPDARIMILTTFDEQQLVDKLFACGINGYVLKETPIEEVIMDIRLVYRGQTAMNNRIMKKLYTPGITRNDQQEKSNLSSPAGDFSSNDRYRKLYTHPLLKNLGTREKQIFQMIILGRNNSEISESLNLSDGTIRNYVHTIYETIDVHKRSGVIIWAINEGLL